VDPDAAPGEGVGVAPGPAADVEHPHPGLEAQRLDQELDLLLGPLREGVAEVRLPHVVGQRLEPMRSCTRIVPSLGRFLVQLRGL
jgi:hypothetical protein